MPTKTKTQAHTQLYVCNKHIFIYTNNLINMIVFKRHKTIYLSKNHSEFCKISFL